MAKTALDNLINNFSALRGDDTNYAAWQKTGVTQATLGKILAKNINPSLEIVEKIAKGYNVTVADLLMEKRSPKIPTDIIDALENQPAPVYDAVRVFLKAVEKPKRKN
jgi:transcriptional regulator with XRE-family HTH domain